MTFKPKKNTKNPAAIRSPQKPAWDCFSKTAAFLLRRHQLQIWSLSVLLHRSHLIFFAHSSINALSPQFPVSNGSPRRRAANADSRVHLVIAPHREVRRDISDLNRILGLTLLLRRFILYLSTASLFHTKHLFLMCIFCFVFHCLKGRTNTSSQMFCLIKNIVSNYLVKLYVYIEKWRKSSATVELLEPLLKIGQFIHYKYHDLSLDRI